VKPLALAGLTRLLEKDNMAAFYNGLTASDRNCGDHSLVNTYSSYDILRHYKLMLKTAASAFNCFEHAV
jgi:hypothetical protein